MKIDTSNYKWWKNREPSGIGYYSFEVHYANGRMITYSFHGDYQDCLERIKKKTDVTIIEIFVGV